jgi:hypothetical protein
VIEYIPDMKPTLTDGYAALENQRAKKTCASTKLGGPRRFTLTTTVTDDDMAL